MNISKIPKLARHFIASDLGKASVIALTWQLTMTLIGALFDSSLSTIFQNPSRPDGSFSILRHTFNWDSNWYNVIIQDAYKTNLPSSVFYPFFPLTVWVLNGLSLGLLSILGSALVINTIALTFAVLALVKIADYFVSRSYRWWIIALFLASPAAIFLHFFYTEALFCALGFWAYLFALRKEWWKMGIVLGLLTAVRLPSVLFILLCGLEFMRAYGWEVKRALNKQILWLLVAPLGFILYGLYLYAIRHDFLSMFHGYQYTNDWTYHVLNPNIIETYGKTAKAVLQSLESPIPFDVGLLVNNVLPLIAISILIVSGVYCMLRIKQGAGIPLAFFALASLIMFSINSNLVSAHRYALACIVIYIAFVHFVSLGGSWRRFVLYSVLYISIILQTLLLILFVSGYFAG